MTPTSHHCCCGSAHGSTYIGWGGSARYHAAATPLACRLADRTRSFPPMSQGIQRRRWVDERRAGAGIDDAGNLFA
jgi:hypothetical protein